MTGWIENEGLKFEGLSDQDIADLNRILPDLQNLIWVAKKHEAQLSRVLSALLPIIEKIIAKQRTL